MDCAAAPENAELTRDTAIDNFNNFDNLIEYIENKHGLLVTSISIGNRLMYADFLHSEGDPILSTPLLSIIQSFQNDLTKDKESKSESEDNEIKDNTGPVKSPLPSFIDIQVECEDEDGNEAYLPIIRYLLSFQNKGKMNGKGKGGWRQKFSEMTSSLL